MLVITAKWGIGDGTVHAGPRAAAVETFFAELRRAVWRAGFRRDGSYRPVEHVQLVFAGDTLDGLCSRAWSDNVRPWHGGRRAALVRDAVAAGVARSGRGAWRHLRRALRRGIDVPAADHRGRPLLGSFVLAPAGVCCVVGERDRVLEATGLVATALRAGIRIGDQAEREAAGRATTGRQPTLVESLVVDAIVPFAEAVLSTGGAHDACGRWLYRLASAPVAEMPRTVRDWSSQVGSRLSAEAWRRAVGQWVKRARLDPPAVPVAFDAVEAVAAWLQRASDDPTARMPPGLTGLGLEGPPAPLGGSLPLQVTSDDTVANVTLAAWPTSSGGPACVARIGPAPEDPSIVDAA